MENQYNKSIKHRIAKTGELDKSRWVHTNKGIQSPQIKRKVRIRQKRHTFEDETINHAFMTFEDETINHTFMTTYKIEVILNKE